MPNPTDPRPYRHLLARLLPSFGIHHARPIDTGWGSFILEVNHEWIVRFPRGLEDSRRVEAEARLLNKLALRLPVPVPQYKHICKDADGRLRLVIYPKIVGRPLPTRNLYGAISRQWQADILRTLQALERFPRHLGRWLGVEWSAERGRTARWRTLYPRIRRRVHPLLSPAVRARDRTYWESFLRDEASLKRPPTLNHGDLFPYHIIVNDRGVAGILDWESACYEDPVGNLTGLPLADGFAARIIDRALGDSASVSRRLTFHRHAVPAYSVLYGLQTKNRDRIRIGLRSYSRTIPPL
ncbi:MAG TPA: phosphotransferase [Thermoplasmata archaeon]|nr:phosphotransferase [Thermoplasmata archaeon]